MKYSLYITIILFLFTTQTFSAAKIKTINPNATLDLKKFCEQVYDLYQLEDLPQKKERLVYKKLNELISETTHSMKITCSDSIVYNKKEDNTTVKSKEIYYADNKTGYFGIYVIFTKKGDDLLMNTSPDKEITVSGKITEMLVIQYSKNDLYTKCRTPLKDFDDAGTVIKQIILIVQG
jgi:hypothetical protein